MKEEIGCNFKFKDLWIQQLDELIVILFVLGVIYEKEASQVVLIAI